MKGVVVCCCLVECLKFFVLGCRSAPTSPSQVGVSGLVTPEELSREPTPDLFTGEEHDQQVLPHL